MEETGEKRSAFFLFQSISMAIQRGNASCILGTVPHSEGLEEIFEFVRIVFKFFFSFSRLCQSVSQPFSKIRCLFLVCQSVRINFKDFFVFLALSVCQQAIFKNQMSFSGLSVCQEQL